MIQVNYKLPYFGIMPCEPFIGIVLNAGVSTQAHRDGMDLGFCGVLPFGDWKGTWSCLYELGLIWEAGSDMIVYFLSDLITHFNTDLDGTRCSFVFNIDFMLAKWAEKFNGTTKVNSRSQ